MGEERLKQVSETDSESDTETQLTSTEFVKENVQIYPPSDEHDSHNQGYLHTTIGEFTNFITNTLACKNACKNNLEVTTSMNGLVPTSIKVHCPNCGFDSEIELAS